MNIDIDRGGCISCGLCEATCPAYPLPEMPL